MEPTDRCDFHVCPGRVLQSCALSKTVLASTKHHHQAVIDGFLEECRSRCVHSLRDGR
ncbi:hypothetical protein NECAME_15022, partial [Necator americanus]